MIEIEWVKLNESDILKGLPPGPSRRMLSLFFRSHQFAIMKNETILKLKMTYYSIQSIHWRKIIAVWGSKCYAWFLDKGLKPESRYWKVVMQ